MDRDYLSQEYYQKLHESNPAYQENNWLVERQASLLKCRPGTLVEIGCGNGKMLREVASRVRKVIGIDWALSPLFVAMPENVRFIQADLKTCDIPKADLVCSADVLEHFDEDDAASIIERCVKAGVYNYHIIACFDDEHSHLTVQPPEYWESLFTKVDKRYKIIKLIHRKDLKEACLIANYGDK